MEAVLTECHADLLRFLTFRLRDPEAAADVLQSFYVKVLGNVHQLKDQEKLRPWMRRILENTVIDYVRTESKQRKIEERQLTDDFQKSVADTQDPFDVIICMCLYKLLPTMDSKYADILRRIDLVGEDRNKVAASLNTSLENVRVRLHRARQALRLRLEETCRTCPIHGYFDCNCDYGQAFREAMRR